MKQIFTSILYIIKNWYTYWVKFLTVLGDIRIYKTPCFVIYDPREYEYNVHGDLIRVINKKLRPGDIVLRKYETYLDNKLIPGKYSHSGIYIGDNQIIHAIAEGVQAIDVIDFFQCDAACILRPNCSKKDKDKVIERAKRFVGTEYDFKFRSSDSSAFYCHELTATCYKDIIDFKTYPVKLFGKEISFLGEKYLADSFLSNIEVCKVLEV